MADADLYAWHLAPVSDAFAPKLYPPSPIVKPEHVGYAIQRHVPKVSLGERVRGYYRRDEALALVERLNAGDRKGVSIEAAYL